MANNTSFDCSAPDLLCNEEPLNDEMGFINGGSDLNPLIDFPCLTEESIGWMLEREKQHLPRDDYLDRLRTGELDLGSRSEAVYWMLKVCSYFDFGALSLYTAVNYLDRFLSVYQIPVPEGGKAWVVQLVAVACLSLAIKMEEVDVPSLDDLQVGEPRNVFESDTIQRMELLVLNFLKWKIKAYTPCNFLDYYLRKMNVSDGEFSLGTMITNSIEIISRTIKGIDFLEFKPSEIAAAVALCVSGGAQAMDIDIALSSCIGVEKERVMKCIELIKDITSPSASNSPVVPHSPSGVLDAACLSYKSDERTVGSCPSTSHSSPENKRRKLDTGS